LSKYFSRNCKKKQEEKVELRFYRKTSMPTASLWGEGFEMKLELLPLAVV
jgi:hypothetical protein